MANISKINSIDNYIYIYHLPQQNSYNGEGTFVIIPQYPDSIQDAMRSSFEQTNALSRSAPVFSYTNSGPRVMGISLNLHRDMMDDINYNVSNMKVEIGDDYVDTMVKQLQAIALPRYDSSNKAVQPPMIAIRFGNEIFIKGVVIGDVTVVYSKPLINVGTASQPVLKYANIQVSFTVYEIDPYQASDVAEVGSFRGLTRTFKEGFYTH